MNDKKWYCDKKCEYSDYNNGNPCPHLGQNDHGSDPEGSSYCWINTACIGRHNIGYSRHDNWSRSIENVHVNRIGKADINLTEGTVVCMTVMRS